MYSLVDLNIDFIKFSAFRYYDKEERLAAQLLSKQSGRSAVVAQSSIQAQRQAKSFIAHLMGGDEEGKIAEEPTQDDLKILIACVR